MKKKFLIIGLCAGALALGSCHKTCTCKRYDGVIHTYTADEVSAHGGSCSSMVIQANTRYYSVCNWD